MSEIQIIQTKAELQKQFDDAGDKLVVIDFFADWCGPCRMIAPKLKAIAAEMSDIVVLKVNTEKADEEVTEDYGIASLPTFVFAKNGKEVKRMIGANEAKLRDTIAEAKGL